MHTPFTPTSLHPSIRQKLYFGSSLHWVDSIVHQLKATTGCVPHLQRGILACIILSQFAFTARASLPPASSSHTTAPQPSFYQSFPHFPHFHFFLARRHTPQLHFLQSPPPIPTFLAQTLPKCPFTTISTQPFSLQYFV